MIDSFSSLCKNWSLNSSFDNEASLCSLMKWCHENISEDIYFEGELSEQYAGYYFLAENYFDVFLTYKLSDLAMPIAQFQGLNTFQYAVNNRYHFFLEQQNIPLDLINLPNQNLMTPLHQCTMLGFLNTTRTLLNKGAKASLINAQGKNALFTALFLPIRHNEQLVIAKKDIFQLLAIKNPELVEAQDKNGDTVLHLMTQHYEFEDLVTQIINTHSSLVMTHNREHCYPIHNAILNNLFITSMHLLSVDGVSDLVDQKERTALHYAAQYGESALINLCIEKLINKIDSVDSEGKTPLLLAAENNNIEAVKNLIQHGANIKSIDLNGRSVLHFACMNHNEALISYLLGKPVQELINLKDITGKTPLCYVKASLHSNLEHLLITAGATDDIQNLRI